MQANYSEDLGLSDIRDRVEIDPDEVVIKDMQWDPFEDNLLVVFGDNSMNLITFQGLDEQTFIAKKFDRLDGVEIDKIKWLKDRSGNFITTSKKVGLL